jgi:hypothetical protein
MMTAIKTTMTDATVDRKLRRAFGHFWKAVDFLHDQNPQISPAEFLKARTKYKDVVREVLGRDHDPFEYGFIREVRIPKGGRLNGWIHPAEPSDTLVYIYQYLFDEIESEDYLNAPD